jgi:hypothetical protein
LSALGADLIATTGGADLAGLADPATGVMLLAGCESEARAAIQASVLAYLISDRAPAEHWHLPVHETPRVIAEAVRLAVPRPVPDAARRGTLIVLPEESPSGTRARGIQALRVDLRADWVTIGEEQILYIEDARARALMLAVPGARELAENIRLQSLAIARGREGSPDIVFASGKYSLTIRALPGDLRWEQVRRARLGAPSPPPTAPSQPEPLHGLTEQMTDQSIERIKSMAHPGEPLRCEALPYGTESSDSITMLLLDRDVDGPGATSFALRLRERLGGDAMLVCSDKAAPSRALWQADRNRLRAIVQLRPADEFSVARVADQSEPPVPIFAVSGAGPGTDWIGMADILAATLE